MAESPGMSEAGTTAVDLYLSHKPVTEGADSSVRHHVSLPMRVTASLIPRGIRGLSPGDNISRI